MSPRRSSAPATAPADASLDAIARVSAELFEAAGSSLASAAETASAETTPVTPRAVVQQVLVALETAQTASEHAPANVKLDFDFGDAQVRVRLQIRDDTVHAHFETDSAELQHSLGQEWRATAAAEPARFARVAEPSFQTDFSPTNHGQHSTGGDRRESTPREPRPESAPYFGRAPASARAATAPVEPALSLTSSPLSQLHAFA